MKDFPQSRKNVEHSGQQSSSDLDKILKCLSSVCLYSLKMNKYLSICYSNSFTTEKNYRKI